MKIKPLHKRLIMRWKIIAHNGIVKFMQFPETKEATGSHGRGLREPTAMMRNFVGALSLLCRMFSVVTPPNKQSFLFFFLMYYKTLRH